MKYSPAQAVETIFNLFRENGDQDYLGEKLSKTEHSIQCAMLAERDAQPESVVIAAFLHDIGHLIGHENGSRRMIHKESDTYLGIYNHAVLGANYLADLGFPQEITEPVGAHVQAKRYLCYKDPTYYESKSLTDLIHHMCFKNAGGTELTWASKETLALQGGVMTAEQAERFEQSPLCKVNAQIRLYDDQGKDPQWKDLKSLDYYKTLIRHYLELKHQSGSVDPQ